MYLVRGGDNVLDHSNILDCSRNILFSRQSNARPSRIASELAFMFPKLVSNASVLILSGYREVYVNIGINVHL